MSVQIIRHDKVIAIEGEMTIYFAAEMKEQLLAMLEAEHGDVVLDLARVTELDTCGLQMLLMVHAVARAADRSFGLRSPGTTVADVLRLSGLNDWLDSRASEAA